VIVDLAVYRDGRRLPGELDLEDAFEHCRDGGFVWVGLHEPTHEEINRVGAEFGIHELAAEDAVHAKQRPKLEEYDGVHLLVLKPARYDDATESIEFGEILLFIGASFLVAVRHGQAAPLVDLRRSLESRPDQLRLGPGAVVHAIVDRVIDDYATVMAGLENDVDEVEEHVFDDARDMPVKRIYFLKRQVIQFHRATTPLREPLRRMASAEVSAVPEHVQEYFRDTYDHVIRIDERVENLRELLNGLLDAAMSRIGVQQNEDMRRISAWVAIGVVPTLITSAYGMNLRRLPFDNQLHGFAMVSGALLAIAVVMYLVFHRRGWL